MNKKIFDITLVFSVAVILVCFGIGIIIPRESSFSAEENRMLATWKRITLKSVANGEASENISEAATDNLPFRLQFLRARTYTELLLLKGESNGVVFAKDGYLLKDGEYDSMAIAEKNLALFSELLELCAEADTPAVCAIAPRGIDVMTSKLPTLRSGREGDIWQTLSSSELRYTDLRASLQNAADRGEYVWYKTDHHWTAAGAYEAYCSLSGELGYSPYGEDLFSKETVSESFLGSTYSAGGCVAASPDRVQLYRYAEDNEYTLSIAETGKTQKGFYVTEMLSQKDKYLIFLGGNYSELSVRREGGEGRETLLIIKDSYANSLVPLLALHYDLELVDLRYFEGGMEALAKKTEGADRVLLLHGIETLATTALY